MVTSAGRFSTGQTSGSRGQGIGMRRRRLRGTGSRGRRQADLPCGYQPRDERTGQREEHEDHGDLPRRVVRPHKRAELLEGAGGVPDPAGADGPDDPVQHAEDDLPHQQRHHDEGHGQGERTQRRLDRRLPGGNRNGRSSHVDRHGATSECPDQADQVDDHQHHPGRKAPVVEVAQRVPQYPQVQEGHQHGAHTSDQPDSGCEGLRQVRLRAGQHRLEPGTDLVEGDPGLKEGTHSAHRCGTSDASRTGTCALAGCGSCLRAGTTRLRRRRRHRRYRSHGSAWSRGQRWQGRACLRGGRS